MTETRMALETDYVELSADIVSAYVSNNSIPMSEVAKLLAIVHATVRSLADGGSAPGAKLDEVSKLTPAQIKKSITHEALMSFEDGKPYKALRRHLTIRGLTPEGYRAKHGLPHDYPMVAASYSAARSQLSKSLGLGQQRNVATKAAQTKAVETDAVVSESPAEAKPKRGRPARNTATAK